MWLTQVRLRGECDSILVQGSYFAHANTDLDGLYMSWSCPFFRFPFANFGLCCPYPRQKYKSVSLILPKAGSRSPKSFIP